MFLFYECSDISNSSKHNGRRYIKAYYTGIYICINKLSNWSFIDGIGINPTQSAGWYPLFVLLLVFKAALLDELNKTCH